jgi:hypothetical protein
MKKSHSFRRDETAAQQPPQKKEKKDDKGCRRMGNMFEDVEKIRKNINQRKEKNESKEAPFYSD